MTTNNIRKYAADRARESLLSGRMARAMNSLQERKKEDCEVLDIRYSCLKRASRGWEGNHGPLVPTGVRVEEGPLSGNAR